MDTFAYENVNDDRSKWVAEVWRESARLDYRRLQREREVSPERPWWGSTTPLNVAALRADRARVASEAVAQLLREREPGLAAILDTVVDDLS